MNLIDNYNCKLLNFSIKHLNLRRPNAILSEKLNYSKGNISAFVNGKKPIPDTFLENFFKTFELDREDIEKRVPNNLENKSKIFENEDFFKKTLALKDERIKLCEEKIKFYQDKEDMYQKLFEEKIKFHEEKDDFSIRLQKVEDYIETLALKHKVALRIEDSLEALKKQTLEKKNKNN